MIELSDLEKADLHSIRTRKSNVRKLQKQGLFPTEFDFPLLLQFELTRKCNVFCKHCYNNSGNNPAEDAMTPEKWKEFCRYIVSKGGIFECILSGGEPLLLGKHLFDIMDILDADGTYFLLITNGYLLNDEIIRKLEKYRYERIQVSIDGATADFHDSFRRRNGSWERAVRGAYKITEAGLPLTIAHSVSPENLHDVDKMCELAYSLGAGSIIVSEISLSGRTYEDSALLLNDKQRAYLLEQVFYNSKRFAGKMKVERSMNPNLQYESYSGEPCGGLIIRPDGDVRIDCMTPFTIGNVLTEDFSEIWNNKGKQCWNHPLVKEYFNNQRQGIRNYVDKDIAL